MEEQLRTWAVRVTKLRSQHHWLLFFSVPKQLLLYQLIQRCEEEISEECVELMVSEVMFLVANDPDTREELKDDIEVTLYMAHMMLIVRLYRLQLTIKKYCIVS